MARFRICSPRLTSLLLQLLDWHVIRLLAHNSIRHFPHLDQVVLRCAAQDPWVIQVPAEVGDSIGVATMHEESSRCVSLGKVLGIDMRKRRHLQFWWAILAILGCLFLANTAEVPEADAAIVARAAKDCFLERMPGKRCNRVSMPDQGMEFDFQVPQIPETY